MLTSDWLGAIMVGILGSAHCIGMCGGIASAMSLNSVSAQSRIATTIFYNLGRLFSYMVAGALVGGAVSNAASIVTDYALLNWLRLLSAIVMMMLAMHIGKWWHGLIYVEKFGQYLWKYISPLATKLLPLASPLHALPLGLLWGWLPCGLVYSALTWAAVSGSAQNGASIMVAFGLGTLPSMLLVGIGATFMNKLKSSVYFRQLGALLLMAYGVYVFVQTYNLVA
jgi:sulfite exporter TauE/SafE